jgi:hypothetical protein
MQERVCAMSQGPANSTDGQPDDLGSSGNPGSLELDWFCFYAVSEGLLTADTCRCIRVSVQDSSDLLSFAQMLIDSGICAELDALSGLAGRARLAARAGCPPPFSVLDIPSEEPPS